MFEPETQTYLLSGGELTETQILNYTQLQEFCIRENLRLNIFIAMASGEDKRKLYKNYAISVMGDNNAGA
jgi:hypothetical protein